MSLLLIFNGGGAAAPVTIVLLRFVQEGAAFATAMNLSFSTPGGLLDALLGGDLATVLASPRGASEAIAQPRGTAETLQ